MKYKIDVLNQQILEKNNQLNFYASEISHTGREYSTDNVIELKGKGEY